MPHDQFMDRLRHADPQRICRPAVPQIPMIDVFFPISVHLYMAIHGCNSLQFRIAPCFDTAIFTSQVMIPND